MGATLVNTATVTTRPSIRTRRTTPRPRPRTRRASTRTTPTTTRCRTTGRRASASIRRRAPATTAPAAIPTATAAPTSRSISEGSHPRGFVITYLAEGATGTFFDTRLALANPTGTPALRAAPVSSVTTARWSCRSTRTIAPHSRATIDVDERRRTWAAPRSRRSIEADVQVVADRTMTWDADRLRQPRRARHADAHRDDLVPRRRRDARLLRPVLPDSEPGHDAGGGGGHVPAAGAAGADRAHVHRWRRQRASRSTSTTCRASAEPRCRR